MSFFRNSYTYNLIYLGLVLCSDPLKFHEYWFSSKMFQNLSLSLFVFLSLSLIHLYTSRWNLLS